MSEVDKTIYNSFEQELINNDYKIFKDNWRGAIRGFQKKFIDDKGTKYFIDIYHYNYKKQFPEQIHTEPLDSYTFFGQFRIDKEGKDACIDIHYSADMISDKWRPVTTLKEVEQFYADFFTKFNVDYYEKYD